MAFHPQFAKNGKFYAFYSAHKPLRSVVSEFRVSKTNRNKIDVSTERVLLTIARPFWNHDGGCILFGPNGKLFITHGDGGSREDPQDNGQNLATLRGTILRIDVDRPTSARPYSIPHDNPFVGRRGARGEIWAYGLRNVWRMSFDSATGELWAGDVGQDYWEEVNLITKGGNYGWRTREGFHESRSKKGGVLTTKHRNPEKLLNPVIEYPHRSPVGPIARNPVVEIEILERKSACNRRGARSVFFGPAKSDQFVCRIAPADRRHIDTGVRPQFDMIGSPIGVDHEIGRNIGPGGFDEDVDARRRARPAQRIADDPANCVAGGDRAGAD
jgi:hypothetical protein